MKESAIERSACNRIWKKWGIKSLKLNVQGQRGWPDRMFLMPGGKPLFIEFKTPEGRLTPLQAITIQQMEKAGYSVWLCRSVAEAVECVEHFLAVALKDALLTVADKTKNPIDRACLERAVPLMALAPFNHKEG